jgi:predicted nuclease of predicted toxin-antitoxin system
MSLLIDQNLPSDLERHLAREFPGCVHVRSLGLERATDTFLWELAKERGLAILTKDLDFRHRSVLFGHPPKVVLFRRGNCSTEEVRAVLTRSAKAIRSFLEDGPSPLLAID